jgi:signal transduction histidine kinase
MKDHLFQGILTTTATVSHLLGQPLTVITGYVDLLSASTKEDETKEKLSIIKSQLELINQHMWNLRKVKEFKTLDIAGVTLLDLEPEKKEED